MKNLILAMLLIASTTTYAQTFEKVLTTQPQHLITCDSLRMVFNECLLDYRTERLYQVECNNLPYWISDSLSQTEVDDLYRLHRLLYNAAQDCRFVCGDVIDIPYFD